MQITPPLSRPRTSLAVFFIVAACLVACAEEKPAPAKPAAPAAPADGVRAQVEAGEKNYAAACVACHQPTGEGIPSVYPPLVDSEWVKGSEERAIAIVLYGLTGPITVKDVTYPGVPMPAFIQGSAFNWTDEQIADTLTYVRQAWGNQAPPVTAKRVTEVRTKMGTRAEMTEDELKKIP